ncbi:MAG: hypothetical protein U0401_23215 [Anaerolineae bacterium]
MAKVPMTCCWNTCSRPANSPRRSRTVPPPDPSSGRLAKECLKRLARCRLLVIALDNLETVPLEPFLRDELVLPTTQAPILWILSGRYNLADERLVEVEGQTQDYKGYRDFLGENPPIVWDMSIFSDADLAEYLAEAARRGVILTIDEPLIDAVKATSSGVPGGRDGG